MSAFRLFSRSRIFGIAFAWITIVSNAHTLLPDKTLVYCSEGSPEGFDPSLYETTIEFSASAQTLYNRLVDFERGTTKLIPSLAERWAISENGRIYTFHLRRGVKFHTTPWFKPTREFNAQDVLFTFERIRNPDMPFRRAYSMSFPFSSLTQNILKIEALDLYTVRFILKRANAPFLSYLALPSNSILSAEYAAQLLKAGNPADMNWRPVGTGPFIFQKYVKDASIYFKGHSEYWKPEDVRLSRLIFSITPDAAARVQKLKANECQVIVYPRLSDMGALQSNSDLQVFKQQGANISYLAYNVTHKPLDDVRVRRALDMAVDKEAIIKAVYDGRAQAAVAPIPPLQWPYDKNLKDTPRDLKQARALLAQAGYPHGFSISLWAMPVQRPYNPNARLMAEIIQADWEKIGVRTKIVTYEWGEYVRRATNGEHDAMLIGTMMDNGDPDSLLGAMYSCRAVSGLNATQWCSRPYSALIQQAVQITDISERTRLYLKAQKIFKREQPATPIAYATDYQVVRKNVSDFKMNPFGSMILYGVGLE